MPVLDTGGFSEHAPPGAEPGRLTMVFDRRAFSGYLVAPPVARGGSPTPRWHRGRMVVLGDAAHATSPASGQGSSLAVEDAVVLDRCLRDRPLPDAPATFEGLRRGRAERVVVQGSRVGSTARRDPSAGSPATWSCRCCCAAPSPGAGIRRPGCAHHVDWDEEVVGRPA